MATLQFNNARDNNVWVRFGIDNGELSNTATKCSSKETTLISLGVDSFTSLEVRVQSSDGQGNGKGDLKVALPAGEAANAATYILGAGGGSKDLEQNAALLLINGNSVVGAGSTKVESTG